MGKGTLTKLICWLLLLAIFIIVQQYYCPYSADH